MIQIPRRRLLVALAAACLATLVSFAPATEAAVGCHPAGPAPAGPAQIGDSEPRDGPQAVAIVVVDQSGGPIQGARVTVPDWSIVFETDARGRALVPLRGGKAVAATVSAPGFSDATLTLSSAASATSRVVLAPRLIAEEVTVRADTGVHGAASTTIVSAGALLTSAAGSVDDALRNTPGFGLFRRSSSRTANPTTQGVTLRGVSGSGASRTLVLVDGLPLNDPFGSWVYWNRVPAAAIERIEVQRGAAGDQWGDSALGGVIRVLTLDSTRSLARVFLEGGERSTVAGSGYGGVSHRGWSAFMAAEGTDTNGAPTVAAADRGPIDVPAYSGARTGTVALGWSRGPWQVGLRGSAYRERRGNGTPEQVNETTWRQASATARGSGLGGLWDAQASGGRQNYFQVFTAVAPDRASERATNEQRVPAHFGRASGRWAHPLGTRGLLTLGADWRETTASVNETAFSAQGVASPAEPAGGTERLRSVFARASLVPASRWTIGLGARGEAWRTTPRAPDVPLHAASSFSPELSVAWNRDSLGAHVSVARAHRVPTLNELYRSFRAGNVVTAANPRLDPERLTSLEAGLVARGRAWSLRTAAFVNDLDRAIANLTIAATPRLVTRQRANSDAIRATGVECEAEWQPRRALSLRGQLALTRARFQGSIAAPAVVGNSVPQTPRLSGGVGLTWLAPGSLTVSAQARASGASFDDDLNTLVLRRYGVVDLFAGRAVSRALNAFVAVENLLNVEIDVARTPVRSIGWPRTVRAGLRLFLP